MSALRPVQDVVDIFLAGTASFPESPGLREQRHLLEELLAQDRSERPTEVDPAATTIPAESRIEVQIGSQGYRICLDQKPVRVCKTITAATKIVQGLEALLATGAKITPQPGATSASKGH